jgi:TPR repeat protein
MQGKIKPVPNGRQWIPIASLLVLLIFGCSEESEETSDPQKTWTEPVELPEPKAISEPEPVPLFAWEDDTRILSNDFLQNHSSTKLWKRIKEDRHWIEVVETFEDDSVKLNTQFTNDQELEDLATYVLLCSEFLITTKGDESDRRVQFIAKEFEWLKLLENPRSKDHYGKYKQYFRRKNRWLPLFTGSNRTELEKRMSIEKPRVVLESFPAKTDKKEILANALDQFLQSPSQPPDSALNIFDWAWPDEAIEYYLSIYNNQSPKGEVPLIALKAKFREGRLRHSLSHSNYLKVIEEAADGGLVEAMLFAARSRAKLSEQNTENYSSALFWYWRMSRHRALDFLVKAYPEHNSDVAVRHLPEKYVGIGLEREDYLGEAQKFEQKVMDSSPDRLFEWYLSMEKRDPLFKTKIGTFYFSGQRKAGVSQNKKKGLEYLSAAATQGEHNAVLYLAKYYYEKCQYLIKGKANKENFFKWAKAASSIRISVHGNHMNSYMANAYGHYYLSHAYLKGLGCKKDKDKHRYHLEESVRSGYTKAGEALAKGYENGTWENRNLWKALALYQWSDPKNTRIEKILDDLKKDSESLARANELLGQLTRGIGYKRFSSLPSHLEKPQ